MAQAIFGVEKKRKPPISGSSTPRERRISDTKASSRVAKSDVKATRDSSDSRKMIVGRVTA